MTGNIEKHEFQSQKTTKFKFSVEVKRRFLKNWDWSYAHDAH